MMKKLIVLGLMAGVVSGFAADAKKAWTDPEVALKEDKDFAIQGEYVGGGSGVQVVAQGDGKFFVSTFKGGLPGAGWDGAAPTMATGDEGLVMAALAGKKKTNRKSPTLGAKAPTGAVVLVGDGAKEGVVKGKIEDGVLWAGGQTTGEYGDFKLHVEFRLPYKPGAPLTSQDRGNSGLYLHNRYEVQVLDSFGLVYDRKTLEPHLPLKSDPKQWCGCFYKFKTADVPMCLPPLTWQTYDIDFTAARFDADGKKTADARITVVQNGVTIHDDVALPKGTGAGGGRKEVPAGPIVFQGHGNPVAFRNVWLVEKK